MSREKEFINNTLVLSVGRFLPRLVSFVTLPLMTALLTKSEYGTYSLISTVIAFLIPIGTLQIQSAAFRFLIGVRHEAEKCTVIITNIVAVVLPVTTLISLGVVFFWPGMSTAGSIAIAFYFWIDSIEKTMGAISRGLGRNKAYSVSNIILSVCNGIGVVIALKMTDGGLTGIIISLGIANTAAFIYLLAVSHVGQYLVWNRISRNTISEMIRYSWPMIPNNLSNWALRLSDRLVITAALGVNENAVYSVANKIPSLLVMAQNVLVMAWQENAALAVEDEDASAYYSGMLDKVFGFFVGCTALLLCATPVLFRIFIKGDYAEAYCQMPVLFVAMFYSVMSSFLGGIYIAHKRTKNVGITTVAAAVLNLLIDIALVKVIGIWAGSVSTLAAYLFLYCYRATNCQRFQKVIINWKRQLLQIGTVSVMAILFMQKSTVCDWLNAAIGIVFFGYVNRLVIVSAVRSLRKRDD